jgi:dihydroorotate dehydrogenase (fumarate)
MTTSALLRNGPDHIGTMLTGLHTWLDAREFTSLEEVRGIMSQRNVGNPQAFERANYIKILQGYRAPGISTTVPQAEIARSRNGSALVGRHS